MTKLMKDYYIDSYSIIVECEIFPTHIEHTIYKKMEIINLTEKRTLVSIPVKAALRTFGDYKPEDVYQVKSVKLNDEDITSLVVCEYEHNMVDPKYNLQVKCTYKPVINNRSVTIQTITKSIVPPHDMHFVHRVNRPTKNYEMTFLLLKPQHTIQGYGFGFMTAPDRLVQTKLNTGLKMTFNNWIYPGEGVLINIVPKETV